MAVRRMIDPGDWEHDEHSKCREYGCKPLKPEENIMEFEITTRYKDGQYGWTWEAKSRTISGAGSNCSSRYQAVKTAKDWCDRTAREMRGPRTITYRAEV